ncbi:MAG: hypothetical protein ACOCZ5_01755 [bacterium]
MKAFIIYRNSLQSEFEKSLNIEVNPYKPFYALRKFIHVENLCQFINCYTYMIRDFIKKEIKIR